MMNFVRLAPALRQRLFSWVVLGFVTLAIMQLAIWATMLYGEGPNLYVRHHTDFLHILTGALIVREGHGAQLYDLEQQRAAQNAILAPYLSLEPGMLLPYNHPPFEAILITPLLVLPFSVLFAMWDLLALLAIGFSLWLLLRTFPLPVPARVLLIAAVVSYHPIHIALWSGQTSPLLLLGAVGVYAAMKRRSELWVAVSLLPLTLKPQVLPPLLLLLIFMRFWRSIVLWIGILCAGSIAAMPLLGATWPLHYLRFVAEASQLGERAYTDASHMPTLRGVLANLAVERLQSLVMPGALLCAGVGLALIVGLWFRARATLHVTPPEILGTFDYLWGTTLLLAILTAIHLGPHDLLLLLPPVWLCVATLLTARPEPTPSTRLAHGALLGLYGVPLLMLASPRAVVLLVIPALILTVVFIRWTVSAVVISAAPIMWPLQQEGQLAQESQVAASTFVRS